MFVAQEPHDALKQRWWVVHAQFHLIRSDVEQCVRAFRMILGRPVHELLIRSADPEHRVVESRRERREKILRARRIHDLHDDSESCEIPISIALIGVVCLVILG